MTERFDIWEEHRIDLGELLEALWSGSAAAEHSGERW